MEACFLATTNNISNQERKLWTQDCLLKRHDPTIMFRQQTGVQNLVQNIRKSTMPLLLKNYSIAKLTYLGIRLNEIKSSLGNEKKNNRNGVNNQN